MTFVFPGWELFAGVSPWNGEDIPNAKVEGSAITLTDFLAVGPIQSPIPTDELLSMNLMQVVGLDESEPSIERMSAKLRKASENSERVLVLSGDIFKDFQAIYNRGYLSEDPSSFAVVYLICSLEASEDRTSYLLFGSDDGASVFLNGKLIHSTGGRRALRTYSDAVRLDLKKGKNLLSIKVADYGIYWGFAGRIENDPTDAALVALRGQGLTEPYLLRNSVLDTDRNLRMAIEGAPTDCEFLLRITDPNGNEHASARIFNDGKKLLNVSAFAEGLYKAEVVVGGESYFEHFVVGNESHLYDAERRMAVLNYGGDIDAYYAPLDIRARVLQRDVVRSPESRDWQRKVVYLIKEAFAAQGGSSIKDRSYLQKPGLHFRSFISRIDGQRQYYRIFVPGKAPAKLPLIVLLPTVVSTARPFMESPFAAAHREAERLSRFAEQLGVAIVWSGYRNNSWGHPCEFAHVDEVLAQVAADYSIDPSRTSLMGACSGGWLAAMCAVRWPNRFASIALLNPMMHREFQPLQPGCDDESIRVYTEWVKANDPVADLLRAGKTPIHIIYDGAEPGHGDLEQIEEFMELAAAAKYPAALVQRPQTIGQHFDAWEELIGWTADRRRDLPSGNASRAYRGMDTGSLSQFFTDRFLVVRGTQGTGEEDLVNERLAEDFQSNWKKGHFGECLQKADVDVTEADLLECNLVLLGNARTNSVWKRLQPELPERLSEELDRHESISGSGLAFHAVIQSSSSPSGRIVLIGARDLTKAKFSALDLYASGWYEFAVYRTDSETNLVSAFHARTWRRLD